MRLPEFIRRPIADFNREFGEGAAQEDISSGTFALCMVTFLLFAIAIIFESGGG